MNVIRLSSSGVADNSEYHRKRGFFTSIKVCLEVFTVTMLHLYSIVYPNYLYFLALNQLRDVAK